ncbi:hypothetical protein FQN49_001568 [Arthroderma sp. PD_2]|nr:hypothetical protein FQN49_001568 [Arthroderma sp. PD_2]
MAEIDMEEASEPISPPSDTVARGECSHDGIPNILHTCFHPYHSAYSLANLPPLLFRLDAPTEPPMPPVIQYLTKDGAVAYASEGNAIKDFQFLPRYISVRVSGWLLEYWMRTDPRLTYRDIKARMTAKRNEIPSDNALNMRREREARLPLGLSCWTTRRGEITRTEVERADRWSQPQISLNTTMSIGYSVSNETGERTPVCLLMKRLDGGQPRRYDLDTFMDGRQGPHIPGSRITAAVQLLYQLQDFANTLGVKDWRYLPAEYFPESWTKRAVSQKKTQASSSTGSDMSFDLVALRRNGKMNVGVRVGGQNGYETARSGASSGEENKTERRRFWDTVNHLKEASSCVISDQPTLGKIPSPIHSTHEVEWKVHGFAPHSQQAPYYPSQSGKNVGSRELPQSNNRAGPSITNQPIIHYSPQFTVNVYGAPYNETTLHQQDQQVYSNMSPVQHTPHQTWGQPPPYYDGPYQPGNGESSGQHRSASSQEPDLSSVDSFYQQYDIPESFRFNGGGRFSIRNNPAHRLNTNTVEVMERNNPFLNLHQSSSIVNQRSFENFFTADLE